MAQTANDYYNEGYCYYTGTNGYPLDYRKAFICFSEAARMGVSAAMNYLGIMFMEGNSVKQDYKRARYWFAQAMLAKPVDIHSMYNLARMDYNGWGDVKNVAAAEELLKTTITSSDKKNSPFPQCCYLLGVIYYEDYKRYTDAFYHFHAAAQNGGIPEAWYYLGRMAEQCTTHPGLENVPKSRMQVEKDKIAVAYYKEAARLKFAPAMDAIGRLNMKYNQNDEAVEWLKKAASLGWEPAKKRLQLYYATQGGSIIDKCSAIAGMFKK